MSGTLNEMKELLESAEKKVDPLQDECIDALKALAEAKKLFRGLKIKPELRKLLLALAGNSNGTGAGTGKGVTEGGTRVRMSKEDKLAEMKAFLSGRKGQEFQAKDIVAHFQEVTGKTQQPTFYKDQLEELVKGEFIRKDEKKSTDRKHIYVVLKDS